jgi:hypothetical protein
MNSPIDPRAVAARLRALIGAQNDGLLERAARRLQVSEVGLRISLDELEPHPSIEVLEAVVRDYGVDPTWLLTGEYDPASHRLALDEDAGADGAQSPFAALLRAKPRAASERPELRLEA